MLVINDKIKDKILREIQCITMDCDKEEIADEFKYRAISATSIKYHKDPKYKSVIEKWFQFGKVVINTSELDTYKYTFFDQDKTYFMLDSEAGIKDFEDYLYEEFTNSEKVWKPTYPIMTKTEFNDRLDHSGNIPNLDNIKRAINTYNVHSDIIYREYKVDQQQRFLKYGSLIIDYKLLEELNFDLFDFFSRQEAICRLNNVYERNFLRHELETMGIDITYTD